MGGGIFFFYHQPLGEMIGEPVKWVGEFGFARFFEVVIFCYVGVISYPLANRFHVPALDGHHGILPVTPFLPSLLPPLDFHHVA